MFRHGREEGGGKQKNCVDEREESLITAPPFFNQNRENSLRTPESFQSPEKEGRKEKKKRTEKISR